MFLHGGSSCLEIFQRVGWTDCFSNDYRLQRTRERKCSGRAGEEIRPEQRADRMVESGTGHQSRPVTVSVSDSQLMSAQSVIRDPTSWILSCLEQ